MTKQGSLETFCTVSITRDGARNVALVGFLLIGILPLLAGCDSLGIGQDAASDSDGALTVNTIRCENATMVEQVRSFTGIVKAKRTSEMGFERGGRISRLLVSEGDIVKAGQTVAELDRGQLSSKRANIQQALTEARTALNGLSPRAMTTDEIQVALRRVRADLDRVQQEVLARARIANGQAVTSQPMTERLRSVERRIAALDRASQRQQTDSLRQSVTDLQTQLTEVDVQLNAGNLVAPFEAMVALRHVSEGSVVSAGMPVVTLVQQTGLEVWVGIPVDLASGITLEDPVKLTIANQSFAGTVKAKLPQVDRATRTRTVIVQLDKAAEGQILPGEVARVQLRSVTATAGIWLPFSALERADRGLWSVMVVEGDAGQETVARRLIELLFVENDRALVRGTLDDGDRVIADGTHRIVPGQRANSRDVTAEFQSSDSRRDPT